MHSRTSKLQARKSPVNANWTCGGPHWRGNGLFHGDLGPTPHRQANSHNFDLPGIRYNFVKVNEFTKTKTLVQATCISHPADFLFFICALNPIRRIGPILPQPDSDGKRLRMGNILAAFLFPGA